MNIQRVIIKNFKLIDDFDQDFEGKNIIIAGENGLGKSSLMQGIGIAMGNKNIPPFPITHGEDNAYIEVITGEDGQQYKFTAKFADNKKLKLEVTAPDGIRDDRKGVIRQIVGGIDFDLDSFVDWSANSEGRKKQVALFKSYFEQDIIDELNRLQQKIKNHEEERTETGQHLKSNKGFIAESGLNQGDFVKYVTKLSATAIQERLDEASENNALIETQLGKSILRKDRLKKIEEEIDLRVKEAKEIEATEEKYEAWFKTVEKIDTAPIAAEMDNVSDHNSMVDKVEMFKEKQDLVETLNEEYGHKTALIESERQVLEDAIKDMGSPVEGLTFDMDQLYYNDNTVDVDTLSTSEIMHLGIKLKMATNPNVKVLFINRGESIGAVRLQAIQDMAKEHGYQILMEEVERGNEELTIKFMTDE